MSLAKAYNLSQQGIMLLSNNVILLGNGLEGLHNTSHVIIMSNESLAGPTHLNTKVLEAEDGFLPKLIVFRPCPFPGVSF